MFQAENHNAKKKMTSAPAAPPVMKGGVREMVLDFSKKQMGYVELIASVVLVLGIVFPANIPVVVRKQASTSVGRLLLFGILFGILTYSTWVNGVLFAVFAAVLLSTRSPVEGFTSDYSFQLVDDKKKWFVEEVLHENPIAIRDEKVDTDAVQDDNQEGRSSVQDSKSSR
jgi:hypothetical protein